MRVASLTFRGQHGTVLLGPTEAHVARYLARACRHGRVTLRMTDLARRLGLCRSEVYRITSRLQALGLFGLQRDQGGRLGGCRIWRTSSPRGASGLDPSRHRAAWARIVAWLRAASRRARDTAQRVVRLAASTADSTPRRAPRAGTPSARRGPPVRLADAMRQFAPALAAAWDRDPAHAPRTWKGSGQR